MNSVNLEFVRNELYRQMPLVSPEWEQKLKDSKQLCLLNYISCWLCYNGLGWITVLCDVFRVLTVHSLYFSNIMHSVFFCNAWNYINLFVMYFLSSHVVSNSVNFVHPFVKTSCSPCWYSIICLLFVCLFIIYYTISSLVVWCKEMAENYWRSCWHFMYTVN